MPNQLNSMYTPMPSTTFYPSPAARTTPNVPRYTNNLPPLNKYSAPIMPSPYHLNATKSAPTHTPSYTPIVPSSGITPYSTTFHVGAGNVTDDSCTSSRSESPVGRNEVPPYTSYLGGMPIVGLSNYRTPSPQQIRQQMPIQRQKAAAAPVLPSNYQRSHAHIEL